MSSLPTPLRAALGLVATALDEAPHLPDKAIELPMLAVSSALQISLRAQQRYAAFVARGDQILDGRNITDDPPEWATFDDAAPPPPGQPSQPVQPVHSGLASVPDPDVAAEPSPAADPAAGDDPAAPGPLRRRAARKTVRAPRNATPSAFDAVGDD
jgi:hypothetical protein